MSGPGGGFKPLFRSSPVNWLEARVDVQKKGSRLAFANCYLSVGESRIVRASAVFLVAGELKER